MKLSGNLKYFIPLIIFLAIDIALLSLDIKNFYHPFPSPNLYDIEKNDSYAEKFQYVKWMVIILSLLLTALARREKKYMVWVLTFGFLFLEDVFRLHQILGHFFYNIFGMTTGSRGEKIMELFAAAFLGFIFLAPAIEVYKKGDALFRKHSKNIFILLALFLFCAIVLDQVHRLAIIQFNWKYNAALGLLEDGGELITESLLAGYLLSIVLRQEDKREKQLL